MTVQDQDWHLRTRSDLDGSNGAYSRPEVRKTEFTRVPGQGRFRWIAAAVISAVISVGALLLLKLALRGTVA